MALPLAVLQEVHELEYKQFNTNDVFYLGLQFFNAGLHPNIQLEVIKSGRSIQNSTRLRNSPAKQKDSLFQFSQGKRAGTGCG
jgi:hypothetical protein